MQQIMCIVNGVEMIISVVVWKAIEGIDMGGVRKFEDPMDGYSKMETYRGMLLDPTRILRNQQGVGGLTMLVYIITYILAPRATNDAQVTDNDLQIKYGPKLGIQLNWVLLIEDIMLKSR